jgi:hypothetical protein
MTDQFAGWTQASVGCHWTRGEFAVSTTQQGRRSGYVVYRNREMLAEFVSWAEVEAITRPVDFAALQASISACQKGMR